MFISKILVKSILIILIVFIILNLISLGKVIFTNTKVTKGFLLDYYFVKISSKECDLNVFDLVE